MDSDVFDFHPAQYYLHSHIREGLVASLTREDERARVQFFEFAENGCSSRRQRYAVLAPRFHSVGGHRPTKIIDAASMLDRLLRMHLGRRTQDHGVDILH